MLAGRVALRKLADGRLRAVDVSVLVDAGAAVAINCVGEAAKGRRTKEKKMRESAAAVEEQSRQ